MLILVDSPRAATDAGFGLRMVWNESRPTAGVCTLHGYLLVGGMRRHHFDGTNFKPRKLLDCP